MLLLLLQCAAHLNLGHAIQVINQGDPPPPPIVPAAAASALSLKSSGAIFSLSLCILVLYSLYL